MSEQKTISPLLDGFTLGTPISEHHGVVCYPAIKENSNKKFIVKMISVPATQVQFDAMLLSGAYKDPGDVMGYFRNSCDEILNEAEVLKNLSKIEGFLPYEGWQMEPITRRRLGYEIYLVSSYKRSLDKYIRNHAFTHLEAINLALDLCAALSVCRQAGYLYIALKPSNIYVSEKKEYRIGDLGFLKLDTLRYAAIPERYFSSYMPPELVDPMESVNLTVDTYAVGMILYQLYNDGHLPFNGVRQTDELPNPCHADYEMAEIIMKAIHPDPGQRWTDPKDLGKAIAAYMQRNIVNDIPITPFIPLDVVPEEIVKPVSDDSEAKSVLQPERIDADHDETVDADVPSDDQGVLHEETVPEITDVLPAEELSEPEQLLTDESNDISETTQDPDEISAEEELAEIPVSTPSPSENEDKVRSDEETTNLSEVSEEVAKILSKADDIIAHDIPEETAFPAEPEQPDPFAFVRDDPDESDDCIYDDSPILEVEEADPPITKKKTKHFEDPSRKRKIRKILSSITVLLLLCILSVGGYWYYQNAYLQTIDSMSIQGTQDQITVLIDTSIDESRLTVTCTDDEGNESIAPIQGGKATFENLQPNTQYTIQLDMNGFHKLVGKSSDIFTTDAPTQILSFHAIAGSEDGSVMLRFTVDGDEPDFWNIRYTADGEEEQLETVTGHSAMITGLTVGKVYTFKLDGGRNFALSGETSVQYLASRLILAENIAVSSDTGTDITVHWNTPGDVVVESWDVRFYDGYGYEKQVNVTDNHILFNGVDPASNYTLEITAAGMTQPSSIRITSDPLIITDFQIEESSKTELKATWKYTGSDPENGWMLVYTIDGSGSQILQAEKPSVTISPLIPGANYAFTLQSADERTVFNSTTTYQAKEASIFNEYNFDTENVSIDLLKTPDDTEWDFESVGEESFTDTFMPDDSISMVLRSPSTFYIPSNKTEALFVFRNAYGNVLPELTTQATYQWKKIWDSGDKTIGEIDIPNHPTTAGNYVMELYFNGGFVGKTDITITE